MKLSKNQIAMLFILSGLLIWFISSLILAKEKLEIALISANMLIGAGLSQWSSNTHQ